MILSHDHQFIFIKTRKTAGTSVEMALTGHCGPLDIVTPIAPEDERNRAALGLAPKNRIITGPYKAGSEIPEGVDFGKYSNSSKALSQFQNHSPAPEIKKQIGDLLWDRYFKFTIERNPWDSQVSRYFYQKHMNPNFTMDFGTFLQRNHVSLNWGTYTINDKVVVDEVILYEKLTEGLAAIKDKIGIDISQSLPRAKSNTGRKKRDYRELYNAEQRQLVAKGFDKVIDTFGYTF
ncbi:MAG: hypothetical protein COB37_00690 [Kordiimonadales bacterium]|nr:MAG: hypothetical protein COB37_00690 [Kordiimonadales bacterium]